MSRKLIWLGVAAAVLMLDGDFIHAARSSAQTASSGLSPNCSQAGICIADLDGNGKQQIVVGNVRAFDANNLANYSYVIIINNNGTVRKRICWADGANNGNSPCPAISSQ